MKKPLHSKIEEHNDMIKQMAEKYDDEYFAMLGKCILDGMDIETSIYFCWNKLMTK